MPKGAERAAVLRTKLLARQNKHKEAIVELDKLIAGSPKGSERLRAAQLAKAESLAAMKDYTKAETLLREVIQATPPEDAAGQAPAYNTLGDCLRAANRPKDALLAYLHTDLLYSKDKEEHPRAPPSDRPPVPPAQARRPSRRFRSTPEARIPPQPLGDRAGRRRLSPRSKGSERFQTLSPRERVAEGRVRVRAARTPRIRSFTFAYINQLFLFRFPRLCPEATLAPTETVGLPASSHSRNPPTKAFALSPARQPGGSSLSFSTLPPPRTTSSG